MGRDHIMSRLLHLRAAAETPLAAAPAPHTASTPRALFAPGVGTVAALLLAVTGCGAVDRDDRPESDYATFAQEVASLPAVASVDADPDASSDMAGRSFIADLTDVADAAVDDPDATDLQITGDAITDLLDDYRYPDGIPHITLTSGLFTASLPWDPVVPPGADPVPNTLDLTDLPHLLDLPDVAEGTLHDEQVRITLTADTDLRTWVEDAVTREGTSHLTVGSAEAAARTSASSDPEQSSDHPRSTEEFTFPLGSDTAAEAVTALFSVTDSVGATVLTGAVDGDTPPTADFLVPTADDLHPLFETLVDEYGDRSAETFSVDTEDGLHVSFPESAQHPGSGSAAGSGAQADAQAIDDVLAAQEQLDAVDASLSSVSLDRGSVEVEARDGDGLRDVVEVVGSQEWPFGPEGTVSVHHPDTPSDHPYFPAADWGDRVDLLASLWDAGFTSVRYSGSSDLTVRVSNRQGPDYTTPSGRDALIRTLREVGWPGTLRISLAEDPHPTFESTATGAAQNPYNSLHDRDDEPAGWGLEFIEAWDASAH